MDFTTVIWAVVVLGALAIVFGLILAVAAKVFEVEVDPRLRDPGLSGRRQLRRLRRGHPGR